MNIDTSNGLFSTAVNQVQRTLSFAPEPVSAAADFTKSLLGAGEDITVKIDPEYQALIERQMEVQLQVQQVTFTSNIERASHETKMAPIRNIRVS